MKKYHLLKPIYYYSDKSLVFEIRDVVSLSRGAFWYLPGHSSSPDTVGMTSAGGVLLALCTATRILGGEGPSSGWDTDELEPAG